MDQLILVAIVALCWVLSVVPWRTVKARVHVVQGASQRRVTEMSLNGSLNVQINKGEAGGYRPGLRQRRRIGIAELHGTLLPWTE